MNRNPPKPAGAEACRYIGLGRSERWGKANALSVFYSAAFFRRS
jgi:hypothetical protein